MPRWREKSEKKKKTFFLLGHFLTSFLSSLAVDLQIAHLHLTNMDESEIVFNEPTLLTVERIKFHLDTYGVTVS